jgi:hypothetical protein
MRRSTPRCLPTLSDSARERLNMYALAASAAGVGILALNQSAEARIVYTPAHIRISKNFNLDLNHDGVTDFKIDNRSVTTGGRAALYAGPKAANRVWGFSSTRRGPYASALQPGVLIGPNQHFSVARSELMAFGFRTQFTSKGCYGQWPNVKNRYLGLEFKIKGKTHFGWARLNVSCKSGPMGGQVKATLTGYAYETIAGKTLLTGQKKDDAGVSNSKASPAGSGVTVRQFATLGLLATGSAGLSIWKREYSLESAH